MASLNKVQLIGNLTRDVEVRYTPKGSAVADISIAVNRKWTTDSGEKQEEVTYIDIVMWGKTAELAGQYLKKGSCVFIGGRLQMESWEDKATGQKRTKLKVVCEEMQFLDRKPEGQIGGREYTRHERQETGGGYKPPAQRPAPAQPPVDDSEYMGVEDDSDIPF